MPKPTTAREALELVRRSGLVPADALDRASAELPADAPGVALARLVETGLLTQFHADQMAAGRWKGFTLGPYRLLDRLGTGGMGTVYLAEHPPTRRRVAIKVLHPRLAADPKGLARFAREAEAAAALDHPHLVPVEDVATGHRPPYLVMEYVDGVNLQAAVAAVGLFPPAAAAECGRQALLGLQHAHEQGLVHRDVKPANLVIDRRGVVRVLDLGVVRVEAAGDPLTLTADGRSKLILGTADYLAPEQAVDSSAVDTRADVYALGATIYFLLAGHPPFADARPSVKLLWKQTQDPPPIGELRADVPAGLAAAIGKMLARDPADRFSTPQAAADALAPFASLSARLLDRLFARTAVAAAVAADPPSSPGASAGESTDPTDVVGLPKADESDLHPPPFEPLPDPESSILVETPAVGLAVAPPADPWPDLGDSSAELGGFAADAQTWGDGDADLGGLAPADPTDRIPPAPEPPADPGVWPEAALAGDLFEPTHQSEALPAHDQPGVAVAPADLDPTPLPGRRPPASAAAIAVGPLDPPVTPPPAHPSDTAARGRLVAAVLPRSSPDLPPPRHTVTARQAAALIGAAMALGLGLAVNFGNQQPQPAEPSPEPPVVTPAGPAAVVVARSGGVDSVRAALSAVDPGGRIELREPVWDEPLTLPPDLPAGVTIAGGGGTRPVWRGLLDLTAANGLTLENLEVDGRGEQPVGVRAGGRLLVRDVFVRGVRAGVEVTGGAVKIERCRFLAEQPAAAGVRVTATGGAAEVADCRFEGPFASAVEVAEPTGVRLDRLRVHGAAAGVRVLAPAAAGPLRLTVERCVFADAPAGLWFEIAPADECKLIVAGNLFDRVRGVAVVPGQSGRPVAGAADNTATDPEAGSAVPTVGFVVRPARLRKDAADDATFLRPRLEMTNRPPSSQ